MSWQHDVTVQRTDAGGPAPPIPVLRVLRSPEPIPGARSKRVLVPGRPLTVGRGEDAGLVLRDSQVSRKHMTLAYDKASRSVELTDSSANGTTVNGLAVAQVVLEDGDVIRCGDSFLLLRLVPVDEPDGDVPALIGEAPSMRALRHAIELVADSAATVLVLGETGTGKELVARAVHELSGREGELIAVNCGAIPEQLAESQLFGHVAGAFTGAKTAHGGFFRAAHGGTLFLDEVGELPLTLQPKLLRALEERAVTPVGSTSSVPCDVRLVAATHQALEARVDEGSFRGDLYARLAEFVIRTPPLRDRREDILPILDAVLGEPDLEPDLVEALLTHPYRFNVRELIKLARELEIRGRGRPLLTLSMIEARLARDASTGTSAGAGDDAPSAAARPAPEAKEDRKEQPPPTREELEAILRRTGGNISRVSRETGRSRRQVYRYLEEHGLSLDDYRRD